MQVNRKNTPLDRFQSARKKILEAIAVFACATLVSSCGNTDAKSEVKKFCSKIKTGESIMDVATRAGKANFDKYWFEKFSNEPSKGENIGIIRPRDFDKKTEKLDKLKHPKTWDHGQFKAMIQELGYSRHVCTVDFAKDKVLKKQIESLN